MSLARVAVVLASLAGVALTAALMVREATLIGGSAIAWQTPSWWTDAIDSGSWRTAGVAGVVALALGVSCLVLAWRQVSRREAGAGLLEVGGEDSRAAVRIEALERSLERALRADVTALVVVRVRLVRRDRRLASRTRVTVQATDLGLLRERVQRLIRRDIGRATGFEAGALVLEVERVLPRRGGGV